MLSMTYAPLRSMLSIALVGLGIAAVAGCGNDVPSGAVAKVGDQTISQQDFDKWLKTAASGQAQTGQTAVPDPPDFTACVAAKQKTPVAKGQAKPTAASLKKQCQQEYDTLKREVMQFLIQSEWVQQEAEKQGIKVSDAEVKSSFADQKKASFPTDKAYQAFLKTSGMNEEDILFRVKLDQLQQKLTQKVTKDASKVSDDDVKEYYDKNKKRFAQPERRDLRIVLTKTEEKANQAKAALDGRPGLQGGRQAVLDRRGLEGPGRQAAGRGQGPAGEGARHRGVRGQEGHARRARSRPSSATTSSRSPRSPRRRSSPRRRPPRRSRTCCGPSASRRLWTTSSRTSARATARTPPAPTTTRSPSARTARRTRPTPAPPRAATPQTQAPQTGTPQVQQGTPQTPQAPQTPQTPQTPQQPTSP